MILIRLCLKCGRSYRLSSPLKNKIKTNSAFIIIFVVSRNYTIVSEYKGREEEPIWSVSDDGTTMKQGSNSDPTYALGKDSVCHSKKF